MFSSSAVCSLQSMSYSLLQYSILYICVHTYVHRTSELYYHTSNRTVSCIIVYRRMLSFHNSHSYPSSSLSYVIVYLYAYESRQNWQLFDPTHCPTQGMKRLLWRSNSDDVYEQPDDDFVIAALSPSSRATTACAVDKRPQNEHEEAAMQQAVCWNSSFRDACVSLQTLTATPQQVLEYLERTKKEESSSLELPKKSEAVLWKSSNVVPTVIDKYRQREHNANESKTSLFAKVASQVFRRVFFSQEMEDAEPWKEEHDDHESEHRLGWQQEIAHIDLAVQCCEVMVRHAAAGKVFLRQGESEHSFVGWIRTLPDEELISKLPEEQINVLMDALLEMKLASIVDDILALGFSSDTDCDIAMALFRLDMAVQATEASLEHWTMQRDAALGRALQCKSQNRSAAAIAELKRKALYDNHLERTRGALLNLEQTQHAVQTAQSQAQVVRVLEETASMWKLVRQHGVTVEQVDDVALDLAEELTHLDDNNSKLVQLQEDDFSEEELLRELENLTLSGHDEIKTVNQSSIDQGYHSFADESKQAFSINAAETKDHGCVLPVARSEENETVIAV